MLRSLSLCGSLFSSLSLCSSLFSGLSLCGSLLGIFCLTAFHLLLNLFCLAGFLHAASLLGLLDGLLMLQFLGFQGNLVLLYLSIMISSCLLSILAIVVSRLSGWSSRLHIGRTHTSRRLSQCSVMLLLDLCNEMIDAVTLLFDDVIHMPEATSSNEQQGYKGSDECSHQACLVLQLFLQALVFLTINDGIAIFIDFYFSFVIHSRCLFLYVSNLIC